MSGFLFNRTPGGYSESMDSTATVDPAVAAAPSAPEVTPIDVKPAEVPAEVTGSAPEPTTAPAATEPDYKDATEKFLATPEGKKYLLDHPEIKKEIDHRSKSVREADINAKVQAQVQAVLTEQQKYIEAERERERERVAKAQSIAEKKALIEEDPTSPLAQRMRVEVEREEREALAAEVRQLERAAYAKQAQELQAKAADTYGRFWMSELGEAARTLLTEEELASIDPNDSQRFDRPLKLILEVAQTAIKREAQKLAKAMAKVEAEAIVQERLGQSREKDQAPVTVPNGNGAFSSSEFLKEYSSGKTGDHKKALSYLKELGLQI